VSPCELARLERHRWASWKILTGYQPFWFAAVTTSDRFDRLLHDELVLLKKVLLGASPRDHEVTTIEIRSRTEAFQSSLVLFVFNEIALD